MDIDERLASIGRELRELTARIIVLNRELAEITHEIERLEDRADDADIDDGTKETEH